ncbi:MAG: MATE family efflux transporter [Oscillospiraceae bacterium]|nr:MATE family efflux transporter [Oscillospiraceae bacterium]
MKSSNKNTLRNDQPMSMFRLTWPIFVELLLNIMVYNVDQWMVSAYSEDAVSAIGNSGQILSILTMTFGLISTAITVLASQYIGAGQRKKLQTVYTLGLAVNLVISIIISVAIVAFGRQMLSLMQIDPTLLDAAYEYLAYVGMFLVLQGAFMALSAVFKTENLMKYTMYISMVMNVVNIVGNYFLIFGRAGLPELGANGAAVSTNISRFVGVVLMFVVFYKKSEVRFSIRSLKPFPFKELGKMLVIGVPSGGESISYDLSQMVILSIVNVMTLTFGTYLLNAKIYVSSLSWFPSSFANAISIAAQVVVGRHIGAGDEDVAQKKIFRTLAVSAVITMITSVLFYIFCEPLLGLFTDNPETIALGKQIMFIEMFVDLGRCGNVVLVRGLQATGDTKYPIAVGIVSMWIVAVGLSYVFAIVLGWGLAGVWIAMAMDEIIRAVIFIFRFRSGKWRGKSFVLGSPPAPDKEEETQAAAV